MKDPLSERLREANWRRKLSPAEEEQLRAHLAGQPEAAEDWEAERRLTAALAKLRDAPVPTNFTARVLQAARREEEKASRQPAGWWRLWHWPAKWTVRVALASVMLVAGLLSYQHVQDSRREERAQSLIEISSATAEPGPEILQDFDAIRAMSQATADLDLLKALE